MSRTRDENANVPPALTGVVSPDCSLCEYYSLDRARTGEHLEIMEVGDDHARMQAVRFGMAEGACVTCVTRIPAGPVVLKSGRQEIAVGRGLAKRIQVRRREPGTASSAG